MMLEDVGLSLNLLKIFVQHRATLLAQQRRTMLASFEQAGLYCFNYLNITDYSVTVLKFRQATLR